MAAPKGAVVGEAVLKSFQRLLERDLSTQPVQSVHALLNNCVQTVDPQLSLHVFGSAVVYGFYDPANDVDFVVLRPEDQHSTVTSEETPDMTTTTTNSFSPSPASVRGRGRAATVPAVRTGLPSADATSQLAKSLQLDCLGRVESALRQRHGDAWDINLVRRARVPVLRATRHPYLPRPLLDPASSAATTASERLASPHACVDFDVTAHRRNGVRNSCLLHHYYTQAPHARWLGLAVKRWSKQVGLNGLAAATEAASTVASARTTPNQSTSLHTASSSAAAANALMTGCLTSYAFNLMVVYYLLQRGLVQFVDPAQFLDVSQTPAVPAYVPLCPPPSTAELGDLVMDFAHFYRHEFNPAETVVSLSRPAPIAPQQLGWTRQAEDRARMSGEKVNYRLCIEDPYEINLNVGRFVTPFKLMLWQKHMEKAAQTGLLFAP